MKNIYYLILLSILILNVPIIGISQESDTSKTGQNDQQYLRLQNAKLFVEANKAKNEGDIATAEKLYRNCIELDPEDAASMYELARIYVLSNQFDEARRMAEKAIKIDPNNSWYKLLLSNIYKQTNNFPESVDLLKQLVEQNPANLEFLEELAYTYSLIGDDKNAIRTLNNLEQKIGINEQLAIQKQKLYQNLKQADSSVLEIEKLINEFPYEIRYYALYAELCLQNKFNEKALWAYSKIAEIDPENAYIHISLSDFYRNSGDSIKAFNELMLGFQNKSLDLESKIQILISYYPSEKIFDEKNPEAFKLISLLADVYPDNARILSIQAEVLYQSREFKKARELLLKIITIDSMQVASWEQLLITESALADFESLKLHAPRAVELFPGRPIPYLFAGMVKSQEKDFEKALEYYRKGLPLVSNNLALSAQFYSFLGDTYHELNKTEASDQAYESAIKLDPENSVVLNNYAYYLALRSEKLEKAKEMSFKAVDLDPENASNLDTKAWVLYKLELYEEAKSIIEQAMKIDDQKSAEVYEHYGDILFKMGANKQALKQWKKARKKGPGSEFLEKKIKEKKLYE